MNELFYIFLILGFLALVLFLEGLYLAWNAYRGPEAQRIERRLLAISGAGEALEEAPLLKKRVLSELPALDRFLLQLPRVHALDRFVLQSGLNLNVATFVGVLLVLAAAGALVPLAFGAPLWAVLGAAAAAAVAWVAWVQWHRAKRLGAIDRQLPDALDLMARAMQAGHAFSSALRLVGTEGMQPIATEFQATFDEINFGMTTEQALTNLAARVSSRDLRFFVVAVLIQRETGGNLAEILGNISALIRERHRLRGTIRVLSAEGRISAWILSIMPFALAGVILLINRKFMSRLWTDPAGLNLSLTALVLMAIGIFWMWRMVKIRI